MAARKKLGELMTEHGYVTRAQVEEALKIQRQPGEHRLLGQILVSRGYVRPPQVQISLARQKELS